MEYYQVFKGIDFTNLQQSQPGKIGTTVIEQQQPELSVLDRRLGWLEHQVVHQKARVHSLAGACTGRNGLMLPIGISLSPSPSL